MLDIDDVRITKMELDTSENAPAAKRRVTLAYSPHGGPKVSATWLIPLTVPDEMVLPLVRNYFHRICQGFASESAAWAMSEDALKEVHALFPGR